MPQTFYVRCGKRWLDLALAVPALILASPALALVAIALRLAMGSPVLFRHERAGKGGKPFTLVKFRTMRVAQREGLESDEERSTPLGKALRALSLDELPTLLHVVRGEMSLVGPRPLLLDYNERYTTQQAKRLLAVPGVTGWAQVNGRNAIAWDEKFRLDAWYVEHVSLALDLKILLVTVWRVVRRDGISASGHATMPVFDGSKSGGGLG